MSATSARRQVIKLANKRNLSRVVQLGKVVCALASAVFFMIALQLTFPGAVMAQVPPRSEAAQEQREEKAPRKDELFILQDYTLKLPLFCELVFQKDQKEARINFCAGKVTYGGDMEVTESARLFFEIVMKHRVGCKPRTKEQREE